MNIQDIENAVNNIQHDIYSTTDGVEYLDISLRTNGCVRIVDFLGIQIWNDEDDMRGYTDEEEDVREPLEPYLRKEVRKELRNLRMIEV